MNKPVYQGATAPNPIETSIWVQTSLNKKEIKIYNDITKTWESVASDTFLDIYEKLLELENNWTNNW